MRCNDKLCISKRQVVVSCVSVEAEYRGVAIICLDFILALALVVTIILVLDSTIDTNNKFCIGFDLWALYQQHTLALWIGTLSSIGSHFGTLCFHCLIGTLILNFCLTNSQVSIVSLRKSVGVINLALSFIRLV